MKSLALAVILVLCFMDLRGQQLSQDGLQLVKYEQQGDTYNLVLLDLKSGEKRLIIG